MGSTTRGLRYPEPTDRLNQVAQFIEDLANDVDGDLAQLPQGFLGLAERLSNHGGIAGESAVADLSVTVNVPAGHRIRISTILHLSSNYAGVGASTTRIKEGSTTLQQGRNQFAGQFHQQMSQPFVVLAPTAGSHTYTVTVQADSSTVDVLASTTDRAQLFVEDLG